MSSTFATTGLRRTIDHCQKRPTPQHVCADWFWLALREILLFRSGGFPRHALGECCRRNVVAVSVRMTSDGPGWRYLISRNGPASGSRENQVRLRAASCACGTPASRTCVRTEIRSWSAPLCECRLDIPVRPCFDFARLCPTLFRRAGIPVVQYYSNPVPQSRAT